ncbi:hypothetical protein U9M48_044036 [Paspalum notatum var. saurae]|uniref:Uncharacterized protein n=1 Tax=Paspalum notatum var. saurae TaxID=547442 RepID=A0AAQ3XH30_PASNO
MQAVARAPGRRPRAWILRLQPRRRRGRPCSMRRRAAGEGAERRRRRTAAAAGLVPGGDEAEGRTRRSAGRPESRTGGGAEPQDGRTAGAAGGGYVPMLCLCVAFVWQPGKGWEPRNLGLETWNWASGPCKAKEVGLVVWYSVQDIG